jgi:hypothetical protein
MKALEILFTFVIFVGIIYTAIPCALSIYCFVIQPHMHNGDDFAADNAVGDEVTEETNDRYQPVPSYANTSHQPKTIAQLQTTLQACNPPQPYSESFDCSELSAYTEHYLESNGFNTTISACFTEGHAWTTVHNIVGYNLVHIECIPPPHIDLSLGPVEQSYDNIQEALAGEYPCEFDWWQSLKERK